MANNTIQARYMILIYEGLNLLFKNDPNVFIAIDLLWYPVEGNNQISIAPDVMVVFGRPKGDRRSYLQWQEDNIPPQVVFEVLSQSNLPSEIIEKFQFYERYGVEEYYVYDPERGILQGWIRKGDKLIPLEQMQGWISPRLKVRFELERGDLVLYPPNGERFISYTEFQEHLEQERQRAEQLAQRLRELGVEPDIS